MLMQVIRVTQMILRLIKNHRKNILVTPQKALLYQRESSKNLNNYLKNLRINL